MLHLHQGLESGNNEHLFPSMESELKKRFRQSAIFCTVLFGCKILRNFNYLTYSSTWCRYQGYVYMTFHSIILQYRLVDLTRCLVISYFAWSVGDSKRQCRIHRVQSFWPSAATRGQFLRLASVGPRELPWVWLDSFNWEFTFAFLTGNKKFSQRRHRQNATTFVLKMFSAKYVLLEFHR